MQISEKLATLIARDGRKKKEIAAAAKISPVALSKYLAGAITPKAQILTQIANALNVDVSVFFEVTTNAAPANNEKDIEHWKARALQAEAKLEHLRRACSALGQHVSALGITVENFSKIISN